MHVPYALSTPTVPRVAPLLLLLLVCCRATLTLGERGSDGKRPRAATEEEAGLGVEDSRAGENLGADRDSKASKRLEATSLTGESGARGRIGYDLQGESGGRSLDVERIRDSVSSKEEQQLSCDQARLQCSVRTGCQMALNTFFLGCGSILSGEERGGCTTACQHALVSLLATEDDAGLAFVSCDCHQHKECHERKQRVQVCQKHVLRSLDLVRDDHAVVSCSFARWICEADTSCLAALRYYARHCSQLFIGRRCTAKCRNSVHILYRQPNAHKLRSCRCQGDEDYDCPSLVNNTERLCFQHRHHRHQHHHSSANHHSSTHHYGSAHTPHLQQQQQPDSYDQMDYVSDSDFRRPGLRNARPDPSINTALRRRHTSGQTSFSPRGSGASSGTVLVALATSLLSLLCTHVHTTANACI